ncbi:MAG: NAD(P)H-dependent glycerol-3-phosphate dehydrogenase [Ectothiorhodospiraceae bacterium]|nr:NAD(P)H-dependent glycerol-3-phosphate dehydrogenase [Ectothiorhodospiraceae bacterium]
MKIGVLGAGSWGTTLAIVLHSNSHDVSLWSYSEEDVELMRSTRQNANYLPNITLPDDLKIEDRISNAVENTDALVIAAPAQFVRNVIKQIPFELIDGRILINVAKGIEAKTLMRMSEVVTDVFPDFRQRYYAVLSGPSHAEEVSEKKPTTVVAASIDQRTSETVMEAFGTPYFRVYGSRDVTGVELGGSLKNIIAIGAGICDGGGYGDNTKAALITRGIAEIRRLGVELQANPLTFSGLSGLGDLIVTTMSRHSRNRFVGEEIGKGKKLPEVLSAMKMVAEGVETTRSAYELSRMHGVDMPIVSQVYKILFEEKDPKEATYELMTREAKEEIWS